MSYLRVENKEHDYLKNYNIEKIAINDIWCGNKPVRNVANQWAWFPRNDSIEESIDTYGLKNPIIVFLEEDGSLRFVASGARIQYAVKNGYDYIDAIVLTSEEEIKTLMIEQAKTEINYLPNEFVHRWWEE